MRFRLTEMITRAEPAVQPVMALYLALVAAAALSMAVATLASMIGRL